jgi:hypothetical protein
MPAHAGTRFLVASVVAAHVACADPTAGKPVTAPAAATSTVVASAAALRATTSAPAPAGSARAGDDPAALDEGTVDWRPASIRPSVARADGKGQYLLLEQQLTPGEVGWSSLQYDLPESWVIESVAMANARVRIVLKDERVFEIGPDDRGALFSEILDGGPGKQDEVLEKIWTRHAAKAPPADAIQRLFIEDLPAGLARNRDAARRIGKRLHVRLTGDGGGDWEIDCAGGSVRSGRSDAADCSLELSATDFAAVLAAPLSTAGSDAVPVRSRGSSELMQLFFAGKVKVDGDTTAASEPTFCMMQLPRVLALAGSPPSPD